MKKVLITGTRGFVGRYLARELYHKGLQVSGIGHGAWTDSERTAWGVSYWLNGDVTKRNLDIVQSYMDAPDVIFHLAGGSSVGPSFVAPEEDFRRSILATAELLEWARVAAANVRLVLASSAAVYGAGHDQAINETDALTPYSPYGYNKRIAEELFESYGKNFGLNVAIVRLFSVYGTELKKQLLWDVCCRLNKDSTYLELGGSGNELRDWFHISDAAELLRIAAEQANPEVFFVNGGSGIAVTVHQIVEHLCVAWGRSTQLEFSGKGRPGDPQYLVANIDRAASLGFVPKMSWQTGVADYVEWFKRVNSKAAL